MAAPLPVHEDGGAVPAEVTASPALFGAMFDRVWTTLKSLYYSAGDTAGQWASAREKYRSRAIAAKNEADLETVIDEMVAAQPIIKPVVTSNGAVVVSGHPLASEAGRLAFEKGGNVVDAMIAVSFALGVVEPEASGIGGDGSAVLYLKGMKKPTVIEYKDMTPIKATADNPQIMQDGRIVADGPAAANIPGVVAGLDYALSHLRQRQGEVGGPGRAGDRARGRGIHPRRGPAVEHRGRPPLPREVAGSREDLSAQRQGAAARRAVLQQGLRRRRCARFRRVAPTRSIAARSPRRSPPTWKTTAAS